MSDLMDLFIAIGNAAINYPVLIIAVIAIIVVLSKSGFITWYKRNFSDNMPFWLTTITLISTIFLADEIKNVLPINLIILNLICHFTYSLTRVYIETSK